MSLKTIPNSTILRTASAVASILLSGALTGCGSPDPVFDPRGIQAPEREQAKTNPTYPMRPLPTTLESSYLPTRDNPSQPTTRRATTVPTTGPSIDREQVLRMSLEECIHRAVLSNLDVKVAGYNPAIEGTRTIEAEARFDPTFFVNTQFEHRNNRQAFNTATNSGFIDRENIFTGQIGLRQFLENGGQAELRYQSVFTDIHAGTNVNPNPFYDNQVVLQLTQPLLQNFGNEINRARITISRNNQRISTLDFRKQIEETTSDLEKAYWQMVQAERDVRINEQLLDNTLHTADILIKRVGQDVTRVQISQANASVESRRAVLIRAKAHVRDLSDQIKRLMNDPDMPITGSTVVLPAVPPLETPVHFELADEIAVALQNRYELAQQQFRIDTARIASSVGANGLLPTLNLTGQVGYQGLDRDFSDAFNDQTTQGRLNYQVGLELDIPLGNRAARSVYQRARLQQQQAIDTYGSLVSQVSLDVKVALREVQTTWDEMVATRQARFAAADSLAAVEQREAGGESLSPTFVQLKLQQQEQLADAARTENQAIANYNIAISSLERSKGTLLRYNNVIMEEDKLAMK